MMEKKPIMIVGNTKREAAAYAEKINMHRPYLPMGKGNILPKLPDLRISQIYLVPNTVLDAETEMGLSGACYNIGEKPATIMEHVYRKELVAALARIEVLESED